MRTTILFSLVLLSSSCDLTTSNQVSDNQVDIKSKVTTDTFNTSPSQRKKKPNNRRKVAIKKDYSSHNNYAWMASNASSSALVNQVDAPSSYKRTEVVEGSFGDWLRHLPLAAIDSPVYYFDGQEKPNQDLHERVIKIDIGSNDLQQCADAVMRLKAEYHYSREEYEAIHFNYTSGDKVSFDDWRQGKKPVVKGNSVNFTAKDSSTNNAYNNFKKYLKQIFTYAGTASLTKEMKSVSIEDMQIGDVFIQGGFPGHAVIVVDMAQDKNGEKMFLIAQSYMPAQSIHILKNLKEPRLGAWYPLKGWDELNTPQWDFYKKDLKRFY